MASRVAGALLALIAAALLAVSVIVTPWWSGHPSFNGTEIKAKEIGVGPLDATGCNTGGDGACMNVPVDATFETVGFALAGVTGLLAVVGLLLAILTIRGAPKRKSFAVFVIIGSMVAALLAVLLVFVGPQIRTEAPLPFSTGLFLFFGGITSALASSLFSIRAPSAPRTRSAPPRPSIRQMPAPSGGLDVGALLAEDALRPSSLGPEPRFGRGSPLVQSPGGALPGPSGPLGAPNSAQPLFSSAPQLRPLYDVAPGQGGTGGFVPKPPQHIPLRAPTPIPRDQIAAMAGIPTPASIEAQRPVTMAGVDPPAPGSEVTDRDLLGIGRSTVRPSPHPVPIRNKTASVSPPVQAKPLPTLATIGAVPPPPNTTIASPRPVDSDDDDDDDEPFDAMQTYQKPQAPPKPAPTPSRPSVPMPAKASSSTKVPMPAKAATLPGKAVPLPAKKSISAPIAKAPLPKAPLPKAPLPAAPLPAAPRGSTPRPPTRLLPEDASIDTDVSSQAVDEGAPATETFESLTNESTNLAGKPEPPSARPATSTAETPAAPAGDAPTEDDELIANARAKVGRTDRELPSVRPPTETSPSLVPAPVPAAAVAITPAVAEGPTDPDKPSTAKLPISTAPQSLPPPTEKQAVASGPSPACPQCEAPMAWVEAHLRFYCKSCKMYF